MHKQVKHMMAWGSRKAVLLFVLLFSVTLLHTKQQAGVVMGGCCVEGVLIS